MKKKSLFAMLLSLALILSLLAGCGSAKQETPAATAAPAAETAPQPAEQPAEKPAASEDKPVKLAMSIGHYPKASAFGQAGQFFIDKLAEYSNGTITADLYTDNALGDIASQVDGVVDGSIDILVYGDSYFAVYVPELQAFELPFLYESTAEARHVIDSAAGDYIRAKFEGTGIFIPGFWEIGMRVLANNGEPITSIEKLQGVRMRVLPVEIQVYAWELFGAKVFAIDGSELFTALQTGVVDAHDNPLEGIYSSKTYEVQDNIILTNHVFTPAAFGVSEKTWDKLSDNQKEAFLKAFEEATVYFRDLATKAEQEALVELKKAVNVVEDPDLSGFQELAPQVYDEFLRKYPSAEEFLNMIYAARDEYRGK